MENKKLCKWCGETKELSSFHKHKKMKDGILNKCSACVLQSVYEWRKSNPEKRQEEYIKRKPKLGITRTMQEYIAEKKVNAKGRKATVHEYDSKRRVRTKQIILSELDLFVQAEAVDLCALRKKMYWH